ncbi:MAG: peptidoglycan-binding protein [Devosia nanyangense]|uniref:Peptidoglycan-binding protein n=1 Tax=Devosia nanyangense TaxID=1228055 RepID=A0A933L436_9HYPH|nr:peptidoglycan-binding protein [Devosia nanyangense]
MPETKPYRFGTRSAATRELQAALAARGLYAGAIDGIFGRDMRDAVAAARASFGLPDGGVDAALLAQLGLARPARLAPLQKFFTRLLLEQGAAILLTHLKGLPPMNILSGYKTYIVAAAMLLTGIAGLLGVDIPSFTGQAPGNLLMEALAFIFLRQGMKTGQ